MSSGDKALESRDGLRNYISFAIRRKNDEKWPHQASNCVLVYANIRNFQISIIQGRLL